MGYEKLNMKSFKEALASGSYSNATAARRAVGRATTLSESEKEQARKLVDAKFGTEPAKAPVAKKASAKKAAPAAKKASPKAAPVKAAKAGKRAAPIAAAKSVEVPAKAATEGEESDLSHRLSFIERASLVATTTIGAITGAKAAGLGVDERVLQNAQVVLGDMLESLTKIVATFEHGFLPATSAVEVKASAEEDDPEPAVEEDDEDTSYLNGLPHTRAESLFKESSPSAGL